MKNDTSNIGDWLFLGAGVAAIGGYLAYENSDQINTWLASLQQPAPASADPTGSALIWLASNWGMILLIAAIIFAAVKVLSNGGSTGTGEGGATKHKRLNHVRINLIQ